MTDERTPSNGIEDLGVTLELAKIAEQIEAQGDKQQKILISIFNQVKAIGKTGPRKVGEDQKGNDSFLLRTEKRTKRTVTASQGGTKENNKGPRKEQKDQKRTNPPAAPIHKRTKTAPKRHKQFHIGNKTDL